MHEAHENSPPAQPASDVVATTPDAPNPSVTTPMTVAEPGPAPPADDPNPPETAPPPATSERKQTVSEMPGLPPTEREQQGDEDAVAEDTVCLAHLNWCCKAGGRKWSGSSRN